MLTRLAIMYIYIYYDIIFCDLVYAFGAVVSSSRKGADINALHYVKVLTVKRSYVRVYISG